MTLEEDHKQQQRDALRLVLSNCRCPTGWTIAKYNTIINAVENPEEVLDR